MPEGRPQPYIQDCGKYPQLTLLLERLDFHKHQFVREACCLFSQGRPGPDSGCGPWGPEHLDGELLLWHAFGSPANTKFFLEDIFRDLKQIMGPRA